MFNKFTLSAFLIFTGFVATAQEQTIFGVKGGLNIASATNTTSSIAKFSAGAFANVGISKSVWFQPGLYYSGKGYKLHEYNLYNAWIDFGLVASGINTTKLKTKKKPQSIIFRYHSTSFIINRLNWGAFLLVQVPLHQ